MFRLLLAISIVLLSSCSGGKCIGPSTGTLSQQEIVVPVMPKGADSTRPAMYWVNSGHKIDDEKKKIEITVEGTINFCPLDTAAKPVKVRMYPEDLFSEREGYEFTDTHVKVVEGDQLKFFAHSYNLTIPACDELLASNGSIIYYGHGVIYSDNNCSKVVPTASVCSAGAASIEDDNADKQYKLHMKDKSGKCTLLPEGASFPRVGGTLVQTPRLQFPLGYIGKLSTKPPNEISVSSKDVVVTGRVHDARTVGVELPEPQLDSKTCKLFKDGYLKTTLSNLVSVKQLAAGGRGSDYRRRYEIGNGDTKESKAKPTEEEKRKIERVLSEYTEYDINCHCGFICAPDNGGQENTCVMSIVRVVDDKLVCPTMKVEPQNAQQSNTNSKVAAELKSISVSKNPKDLEKFQNGDLKEVLGLDFKVPVLPNFASQIHMQNAEPTIYEMAQGASAAIVDLDLQNNKGEKAEEVCKGSNSSCKYIPNEIKGLGSGSTVPFSKGSLKLNYKYDVEKTGRLFLFYNVLLGENNGGTSSGRGNSNSKTKLLGFYDIEVHRTCYASEGKNLYMYIGDTPPEKIPGEGGNVVNIGESLQNGKYTIDGESGKKKGYIYFGIKVDPGYEEQLKKAGDIENNYTVRMFVPKWPATFSRFFSYLQGTVLQVLYGTAMTHETEIVDVSKKVGEALSRGKPAGQEQKMGAVQQIYNNQVVSKPLWSAVRALLTLYLVFSVLGYIIGVLQVTKYDLVVRIAKITMILTLVSPGSWDFFYRHCFSLFIEGIPSIISAFNGYVGGDTSFKFLDSTLGLFLESDFWLRMLSLIPAGPVGWLLFVAIIWALWAFFKAMLRAIILYLFVIVALAFLVTLAPIFITFVLFQLTKGLFDAWIKMIVNFSLQPIILFASLAFLNQLILTSIHAVTDFTACETCIIGFDIVTEENKSIEKKDICVVPALLPIGFSNDLTIEDRIREDMARGTDKGFMGLPFSLAMVFVLVLACKATEEFGHISEVLAHSISGSVAGVAASAAGATQAMLGVVGLDAATQNLIKSARGMTPVGTEKLAFDTAESSQPRYEGAIHRPGLDPQGTVDAGGPQGAADSRGDVGDIAGPASVTAARAVQDVGASGDIVRGAGGDGAAVEFGEPASRRVADSGVDVGGHQASDEIGAGPAQGGEQYAGSDVVHGGGDSGKEVRALPDGGGGAGTSIPNSSMVGSNGASQDTYSSASGASSVESGDNVVYSAHASGVAGFEDLLGSTDPHSALTTSSEYSGRGASDDSRSDIARGEDANASGLPDNEENDESYAAREDILHSFGDDASFPESREEIGGSVSETGAADSGSAAGAGESTFSVEDDGEERNYSIGIESAVSESEDVVTSDRKSGALERGTDFSSGEGGFESHPDGGTSPNALPPSAETSAATRDIDTMVDAKEANSAEVDSESARDNYTVREQDFSYPEGAEARTDSDKEQGQNTGDGFEEKLSKDPDNVRSGNDKEDK